MNLYKKHFLIPKFNFKFNGISIIIMILKTDNLGNLLIYINIQF